MAGIDIRSSFKQRLTGLNLEMSFSKIGCHTNIKEFSQLSYLLEGESSNS